MGRFLLKTSVLALGLAASGAALADDSDYAEQIARIRAALMSNIDPSSFAAPTAAGTPSAPAPFAVPQATSIPVTPPPPPPAPGVGAGGGGSGGGGFASAS